MNKEEIYNDFKGVLPEVDLDTVDLAEPVNHSASHVLQWGDKRYYVKNQPGDFVGYEASVHEALTDLDFIPMFVAFKNGWLITDYVGEKSLERVDDDILGQMIDISKTLYGVDAEKFPAFHIFDFYKHIKEYYAHVKDFGRKDWLSEIDARWEMFAEHAAQKPQISSNRFFHMNPDRKSWIRGDDNRLYLTGWESGRIGDFAIYTANLVTSLQVNPYLRTHQGTMSDRQAERFLDAFVPLNGDIPFRTHHYIPYSYMDYMLWYVEKWENIQNHPEWFTKPEEALNQTEDQFNLVKGKFDEYFR